MIYKTIAQHFTSKVYKEYNGRFPPNSLEMIAYKAKLTEFSQEEKDLIVGTLLGDSTISQTRTRKSYNIKWEQSIKSKDYLFFLYNIIEAYTGHPPKLRNITGGGAKDRQSYWFRTYGLPIVDHYEKMFYTISEGKRKKIVPSNLDEILTPRALAYWMMDDGCTSTKSWVGDTQNKSDPLITSLFISTHSFTKEDNERLIEIFYAKFGLVFRFNKDKRFVRLRLANASYPRFRALVDPYFVECMRYKLPLKGLSLLFITIHRNVFLFFYLSLCNKFWPFSFLFILISRLSRCRLNTSWG